MKARMEHEFRMREIEVRKRNSGAGRDAENAQDRDNNSGHGSRSAGMKAFNKEKDDLDMYLTWFERACVAFEVRPEHRSTQLPRLLQGQALDVYQRLTDEKIDDYEVLQVQLLKRFRLTEGGYRKKFKKSKIEPGESPEQFVWKSGE